MAYGLDPEDIADAAGVSVDEVDASDFPEVRIAGKTYWWESYEDISRGEFEQHVEDLKEWDEGNSMKPFSLRDALECISERWLPGPRLMPGMREEAEKLLLANPAVFSKTLWQYGAAEWLNYVLPPRRAGKTLLFPVLQQPDYTAWYAFSAEELPVKEALKEIAKRAKVPVSEAMAMLHEASRWKSLEDYFRNWDHRETFLDDEISNDLIGEDVLDYPWLVRTFGDEKKAFDAIILDEIVDYECLAQKTMDRVGTTEGIEVGGGFLIEYG